MHRNNILIAAILGTCVCVGVAQSPVARCFDFTWLGPRYTNESVFMNATCSDATRLANGIPCREPLVVSYDGTWPDVHHIWSNYGQHASCVLANNDVCAQFTYFFNGYVENSTYMCTRAVDNMGQAITSGCYEQRNGSFSTRTCICRSIPGAIPCNNTVHNSAISMSVFVIVLGAVLREIGFVDNIF